MTFLEMRADEPPFLNQENFCLPQAQPGHFCKVRLHASRTETSHRPACPSFPSDPLPVPQRRAGGHTNDSWPFLLDRHSFIFLWGLA